MTKQLIRQLNKDAKLVQCSRTGITWVENSSTGLRHSAHPSIHETGSVRGMKANGYWGKNDRTVRTHGFIYNIDHFIPGDQYDTVALKTCACGGNHGRSQR